MHLIKTVKIPLRDHAQYELILPSLVQLEDNISHLFTCKKLNRKWLGSLLSFSCGLQRTPESTQYIYKESPHFLSQKKIQNEDVFKYHTEGEKSNKVQRY